MEREHVEPSHHRGPKTLCTVLQFEYRENRLFGYSIDSLEGLGRGFEGVVLTRHNTSVNYESSSRGNARSIYLGYIRFIITLLRMYLPIIFKNKTLQCYAIN